jgi:shikimate dehydrogenase
VIDALPDLLRSAQRLGFDGLNITHPCKQAVIQYLDDLCPDAQALGAVNTVILRDGKRVGHNTDWFGCAEGFRRGLPDAALGKVVQFGAGGAGAAVAHAALTLGAQQLTLIDVDPARAQAVADRVGGGRIVVGRDAGAALASADGAINATPLGMDAHPGMAFPASLLRPSLWVAEVVYVPLETQLLREARAVGCRTVDGGGMAVFQAVEAFRLFSGETPDAAPIPVEGLSYLLRCSRKSETAPVNGCRNCPIMPPGIGLMVPYFSGQRSAGKCQVPNNRSHSGVWAV